MDMKEETDKIDFIPEFSFKTTSQIPGKYTLKMKSSNAEGSHRVRWSNKMARKWHKVIN